MAPQYSPIQLDLHYTWIVARMFGLDFFHMYMLLLKLVDRTTKIRICLLFLPFIAD